MAEQILTETRSKEISQVAAAKREPSAPEGWLDRYGDALYAYALIRVRDASAAEDLVQETLLAAITSAHRFQGESQEKTWLIGILKHKVLDHLRRSGRETRLDADAMQDELDKARFDEHDHWQVDVAAWSDPEGALQREEFWQVLHDCIGRLPERLGIVFALRELDGMDTDTLVKTLNISSRNNLWVMLSRARGRMRQCLATNFLEA